jgi:SAM-dependent methyltransferase
MTSVRGITYLSAPAKVSMADHWFEIASIDHFWIRRRFRVLQHLAGDLISEARTMAEVGCGSGMLQRQIEEGYGREVAGFDLNEVALKKNVSRLSTVHCYNVLERHPSLREQFDVIFLFDVLEHIVDEVAFLNALTFHLSPGGRLIVNVPAGQWAYSDYDRAAGHVRRYLIRTLRNAIGPTGLSVTTWTYWGCPLVPVLLLRNLRVKGRQKENEIIRAGFDSGNRFINEVMGLLAACEPIPQKLIGTSLMAILQVGSRGMYVRPLN